MLFYDFEVFKYDWLVEIIDSKARKNLEVVNSREQLQQIYDENQGEIWIGYNSRQYDQYILKAILCGFNPKEMNDWIIKKGIDGWQFSNALRNISLINYDVMPNPPIGLKTLEGFMGSDIKETDVPFDLDRKLTPKELEMTKKYCRHDVEETAKVFVERKAVFEAMFQLVQAFNLPLRMIGSTEAQITAKVLDCQRHEYKDEFDYYFLPCIRLNKYRFVLEAFDTVRKHLPDMRIAEKQAWYKAHKGFITAVVAGVPHTFGFGGLHGAPDKPVHAKGLLIHVDVGSYYPSLLTAWKLVTRSAHNENYKKIYDTRMQLKREGKKKEQAPYKKLLNSLSGAMKDVNNAAYDPRNNNIMCVNGQLMLLDLIEHLEAIQGFVLIQSNTDGLIVQIPDTDEAFKQLDDICYEWECRCSTERCNISLGLDTIAEIYQKDVNNYLWIDSEGGVERKGAYVKNLSNIDFDLPVINSALVEYMTKHIPVEQTINDCTDLIQFQKLVKLSDKYKNVKHECGMPETICTGKRVIKTHYEYHGSETFTYKSYRVFASKEITDGRIMKCGGIRGNDEKFANTPDHCFVLNDDVKGMQCPQKLDKQWYIDLAHTRLKQFGI